MWDALIGESWQAAAQRRPAIIKSFSRGRASLDHPRAAWPRYGSADVLVSGLYPPLSLCRPLRASSACACLCGPRHPTLPHAAASHRGCQVVLCGNKAASRSSVRIMDAPELPQARSGQGVGIHKSTSHLYVRSTVSHRWSRLAIARAAMPVGSAQHTRLASPWRLLLAPFAPDKARPPMSRPWAATWAA